MLDRHHVIKNLAYRNWEKSGKVPGRDEENWLAAEREYESYECADKLADLYLSFYLIIPMEYEKPSVFEQLVSWWP